MNAHATITLNNGVEMPALGFGVFQTPPDERWLSVHISMLRLVDRDASQLFHACADEPVLREREPVPRREREDVTVVRVDPHGPAAGSR